MKKVSIQFVQVTCAIVWCLFAAGIIFGFAALKPILIEQGVYAELCRPANATMAIGNALGYTSLDEGSKPCTAQDLKLNFMFTVGAGVTNVVALVVGWVLDSKGPRVCGFIGSFFLTLGALSLAWSSAIKLFDPYLAGYTLLAIGGPFVFISTFQLANSFPTKSGTVLALLTGAFDSSSALFYFYRLSFQNWTPDLTLKKFFTGYLIVPCFIFLCQVFIMPKESYKTLGAVHKLEVEGLDMEGNLPEGADGSRIIPDEDERQSLLSGHSSSGVHPVLSQTSRRKSVWENYVEAKLEKKTNGVFGVMHGKPAKAQIKSPWFLLMLAFTIICMLRINYFVATVRSQEEYLLGSAKAARKINSIFDVALPLGGVVSIPFIGAVLDNFTTLTAIMVVASISVTIGILGLVSSFTLNLIGIFMLVAYRPFYYTVVSDYCAKVFGFDTFGTVYGLLMCLSGVLNMTQSLLDRITHTTFKMNPTPINSALVAATAISASSLIFFVHKESKARQERMRLLEQVAATQGAPVDEQQRYGSA